MRTIMPAFGLFVSEAKIIGRLVVGYGELEVDLLNCVQVVFGDFDAVLKALFARRGAATDQYGRKARRPEISQSKSRR